jgi:hypothetical protein
MVEQRGGALVGEEVCEGLFVVDGWVDGFVENEGETDGDEVGSQLFVITV